MAELNNNKVEGAKRVSRPKQLPRVDLTAMVDLAFLLITFFMLTTTLAKQNGMELSMPVDTEPQGLSEKRTMTICLGKDNKLQWYMGTFNEPLIRPTTADYGVTGIRNALLKQSEISLKNTGKRLVVIIKPSNKSNYKNLVDILDEMAITRISSYAIVDITKEELSQMKVDRIY